MMDYEIAYLSSDSISNSEIAHKLKTLASILYNDGQVPMPTVSIKLQETPSEDFTTALNYLIQGYYNFKNDAYKTDAFKFFLKAYAIAETLNRPEFTTQCLLALLEVYHRNYFRNDSEYNTYLDRYLALSNGVYDDYWHTYYTIIYFTKSLFELDANYYAYLSDLEAMVSKIPKSSPIWITYYFELGLSEEIKGNYSEALSTYDQILNSSHKAPFLNYFKLGALVKRSSILGKLGKNREGLKEIKKAKNYYAVSDSMRVDFYISNLSSVFYENLKVYDSALYHKKIAAELINKLEYRNNAVRISQLKVINETERKENENLKLQANIEDEKAQKRNITLAGILLLVIGATIGSLAYKNTKRKQRIAEQQREIEIQKTEKLLKEQELNSIDAMLEGQEKERQRLASDLHDSAGATLAAAKLHFNHLKSANKNSDLENHFAKTNELLEQAYTEVRSMAHLKNSGVIAKQGLLPAIEKLAKQASMFTLQISVNDFGLTQRLDNKLEITIFRVIQELVTNIVKHSKATEANISITQHEDVLNIIVEDNGIGFKLSKINIDSGMGLSSLERRIEFLEGNMEVDSTLNKGTTVSIDIPL